MCAYVRMFVRVCVCAHTFVYTKSVCYQTSWCSASLDGLPSLTILLVALGWKIGFACSVVKNGGDGFLYFGLWKSAGMVPPPGGYTEEDFQAMTHLRDVLLDQHIASAAAWFLGELLESPVYVCGGAIERGVQGVFMCVPIPSRTPPPHISVGAGHVHYLTTRFPDILGEEDNSWGLIRMDGTEGPAYHALKAAFSA